MICDNRALSVLRVNALFLCMSVVKLSVTSAATDVVIRPLQTQDLPHLLHIQHQCYAPSVRERPAVLLQKITLAPAYCWLAVERQTQQPLGYVLAHPWAGHTPPVLNDLLNALPPAADCFYVHDIAIAPRGRGLQLAQRLYHTAKRQAQRQGLRRTALTAVQGAASYWARLGYQAVVPC